MLSPKILKNGAIWCILKCILIKYQGKNSLKINSLLEEDEAYSPGVLKQGKYDNAH